MDYFLKKYIFSLNKKKNLVYTKSVNELVNVKVHKLVVCRGLDASNEVHWLQRAQQVKPFLGKAI